MQNILNTYCIPFFIPPPCCCIITPKINICCCTFTLSPFYFWWDSTEVWHKLLHTCYTCLKTNAQKWHPEKRMSVILSHIKVICRCLKRFLCSFHLQLLIQQAAHINRKCDYKNCQLCTAFSPCVYIALLDYSLSTYLPCNTYPLHICFSLKAGTWTSLLYLSFTTGESTEKHSPRRNSSDFTMSGLDIPNVNMQTHPTFPCFH